MVIPLTDQQDTITTNSTRASIRTRVWLDIALFVGYFLLSAPQSTGIPFHEYFTVVFIPIFVTHVVLDWSWINASSAAESFVAQVRSGSTGLSMS